MHAAYRSSMITYNVVRKVSRSRVTAAPRQGFAYSYSNLPSPSMINRLILQYASSVYGAEFYHISAEARCCALPQKQSRMPARPALLRAALSGSDSDLGAEMAGAEERHVFQPFVVIRFSLLHCATRTAASHSRRSGNRRPVKVRSTPNSVEDSTLESLEGRVAFEPHFPALIIPQFIC